MSKLSSGFWWRLGTHLADTLWSTGVLAFCVIVAVLIAILA